MQAVEFLIYQIWAVWKFQNKFAIQKREVLPSKNYHFHVKLAPILLALNDKAETCYSAGQPVELQIISNARSW